MDAHSGNGKLDEEEFNRNIREIGFEATDAEMAELFLALDVDGSKSLASKELVSALARLQQEAIKKVTIETAQMKTVAEALQRAEDAQTRIRALKMV